MDRTCELCQGRASVYCAADEAYVCWECDAKVHGANFIVARHARSILCQKCQSPTLIWAGSCSKQYSLCPTCSPTDLKILAETEDQVLEYANSEHSSTDPSENDNEEEEVSTVNMDEKCYEDMSVIQQKFRSSKCRSRASSPDSVIFASNRHLKKRGDGRFRRLEIYRSSSDSQSSSGYRQNHSRRAKACIAEHKDHNIEGNSSVAKSRTEERLEAVLRRWNRHLGLESSHVIPVAMHLIRRVAGLVKSHRLQRLDARVALAACLWVAIKLDSSRTIVPRVDRFERCTGVSADVMLAVEAQFYRALDCIKP